MKKSKNEENSVNICNLYITPYQFEKMLGIYGMTKTEYCELRDVSHGWFYIVLRKRDILSVKDMLALSDSIGEDVFISLARQVGVQVPLQESENVC